MDASATKPSHSSATRRSKEEFFHKKNACPDRAEESNKEYNQGEGGSL